MDKKEKDRALQILGLIKADMESDISAFEGKPFTGLTVGTQFGNQGAAIDALCNVLTKVLDHMEVKT